ncbi:unnamed protein product, partial [marine sediment metagenome]
RKKAKTKAADSKVVKQPDQTQTAPPGNFCTQCGNNNDEGVKFCIKCGNQL